MQLTDGSVVTRAHARALLVVDLGVLGRGLVSAPAVVALGETQYILVEAHTDLLARPSSDEFPLAVVLEGGASSEAAQGRHSVNRDGRGWCRDRYDLGRRR
jgi:hypothetical protein